MGQVTKIGKNPPDRFIARGCCITALGDGSYCEILYDRCWDLWNWPDCATLRHDYASAELLYK